MILVYSEYQNGQISFGQQNVEGVVAEARRYILDDHFMRIEHEYEVVEVHDVAELLAHEIQGKSVYRLATPDEQDALLNKQQKVRNLREVKLEAKLEAKLLEWPAKANRMTGR